MYYKLLFQVKPPLSFFFLPHPPVRVVVVVVVVDLVDVVEDAAPVGGVEAAGEAEAEAAAAAAPPAPDRGALLLLAQLPHQLQDLSKNISEREKKNSTTIVRTSQH